MINQRMHASIGEPVLTPDEAYSQAAIRLALYRLTEMEIPQEEKNAEAAEPLTDFDRKMIGRIREFFKGSHQRQKIREIVNHTLITVAVIVLLMNLTVVTACAFSSEFRQKAMRLLVTVEETHSQIKTDYSGETQPQAMMADIESYRLRWFPNDLFSETDEHNGGRSFRITYQDPHGLKVVLYVFAYTARTSLDTEGMEHSIACMADKEIDVFRNDPRISLVWQGDNVYFILDTYGMTESEAIAMAMSVQREERAVVK